MTGLAAGICAASQPAAYVLQDAGAEYHHYTSDVTRTWPVNGRFSPAQKAVYEAVLDVNEAIIKAHKVLAGGQHCGGSVGAVDGGVSGGCVSCVGCVDGYDVVHGSIVVGRWELWTAVSCTMGPMWCVGESRARVRPCHTRTSFHKGAEHTTLSIHELSVQLITKNLIELGILKGSVKVFIPLSVPPPTSGFPLHCSWCMHILERTRLSILSLVKVLLVPPIRGIVRHQGT